MNNAELVSCTKYFGLTLSSSQWTGSTKQSEFEDPTREIGEHMANACTWVWRHRWRKEENGLKQSILTDRNHMLWRCCFQSNWSWLWLWGKSILWAALPTCAATLEQTLKRFAKRIAGWLDNIRPNQMQCFHKSYIRCSCKFSVLSTLRLGPKYPSAKVASPTFCPSGLDEYSPDGLGLRLALYHCWVAPARATNSQRRILQLTSPLIWVVLIFTLFWGSWCLASNCGLKQPHKVTSVYLLSAINIKTCLKCKCCFLLKSKNGLLGSPK